MALQLLRSQRARCSDRKGKVRYLVILRDKQGRPVDSREGVLHYGKIRPGLAMRTSNGNGQFDVEHETKKPLGKIDVRILEFGVPE